MIVCKFGGTAITPHNLNKVKDIVLSDDARKVVVVSAIGREFVGDVKVTDLLLKVCNEGVGWNAVKDKYLSLVDFNKIDVDLALTFAEIEERWKTKNTLADVLSVGEELAAKCVAACLGRAYVEAENVIAFSRGGVDLSETKRRLRLEFQQHDKFVLGGFYGGENGSRRLFPRGGSDITASIVAEALDATLCENWVDCDGVQAASPRIVFNPKIVRCISYENVYSMCSCGAEVLHPDCIKPLARASIPLNVRNFFNVFDCGTIIGNDDGEKQLLGIAAKAVDGCYVTKIVFSYSLGEAVARLNECAKHGVCFQKSEIDEGCVVIYSKIDYTKEFYKFFVT